MARGLRSRAVGIVRVSTTGQDIGAAAQRTDIEQWCEKNGVELVAMFEDIGVSGAATLLQRPGLVSAIAALTEHKAGRLLAVRRDRFARHRHTIADLEREVSKAGAILQTTDGRYAGDDSEAEEIIAGVDDLVARLELRKIKKRNAARARQCIASGRTHGGDPPFGWRIDPDGTVGSRGTPVQLIEHKREQKIVARILKLRGKGLSSRAVAHSLNEASLTRRAGGAWTHKHVLRVLRRVDAAAQRA